MTYQRAKTAQQERADRAADKARRSQVYEYDPVGWDVFDARTNLKAGDRVVKIQPSGTPRNGTMGMTFVGDPDTGRFIGLVMVASLKNVTKGETR